MQKFIQNPYPPLNPPTSNPREKTYLEKSSNLQPEKIIKPTCKNQTQKFNTSQHP